MASTTVSQFKQLFPATATPSKLLVGKVPIKLKLKNDWGSETLDDLTKIVINFGVSGSAFHLSKVEDGCIAVIWLCSTTEVKQLKTAILVMMHLCKHKHRSQAGVNQLGMTAIPARECRDSCRLCHSFLVRFL